jgi:glyoxylase-like metal-dependent hydrolase (beta-lactamase superfamily II)
MLASSEARSALIIDPGAEAKRIQQILSRHRLKTAFIVNTHGHIDHIGCDNDFGVPVYIHKDDVTYLKNFELNLSSMLGSAFSVNVEIKTLQDGQMLTLDDMQLEVIHMPGHTPGGIALRMKRPQDKLVFTGDSLFALGIGRTDFPGADQKQLLRAIKKNLMTLPDDTQIFPGHGPFSTIGQERRANPFLR